MLTKVDKTCLENYLLVSQKQLRSTLKLTAPTKQKQQQQNKQNNKQQYFIRVLLMFYYVQ